MMKAMSILFLFYALARGATPTVNEYILILSEAQYGQAIGVWRDQREIFAKNPNRYQRLFPEARSFEWMIPILPSERSEAREKIVNIGAERWAIVHAVKDPRAISNATSASYTKKSGLVLPAQLSVANPVNDPNYGSQAELFKQIGFSTALLPNKRASFGSRNALVLLDSGLDSSHEDLATKIDQASAASFTATDPFRDQGSHGTAMAGMAAITNNGIGVTGISQNTPIISLQVFKMMDAGNGRMQLASSEGTVLKALLSLHLLPYKKLVVNMSFVMYEEYELWPHLLWHKVFDSLKERALFIAAAGNSSWSVTESLNAFPCNASYLENVICFGSVDRFDNLSHFSNFGWHVNLTAPGEEILTTLPGNRYGKVDGTSISAALVWVSAALLYELAYPDDPTPTQIKKALLSGARFSPGLIGKTEYPRILNIERARWKLKDLLSREPETAPQQIRIGWMGNLLTMDHQMLRGEKVGIFGSGLRWVQPYLNGKMVEVEENDDGSIIFTLPKSSLRLYPAPNKNELLLVRLDGQGYAIAETAQVVLQFVPVEP